MTSLAEALGMTLPGSASIPAPDSRHLANAELSGRAAVELIEAGLTPSRLRARLTEEARRFVEDPNVTVVVRQINSRKVFVTGEIVRPGSYPLMGQTTVLQMLAIAGGLKEYADDKNIMVMRFEKNYTVHYTFNYHDVSRCKSLTQNLELKPGDTIVVP